MTKSQKTAKRPAVAKPDPLRAILEAIEGVRAEVAGLREKPINPTKESATTASKVPFKSSKERPPRIGDVVRYLDSAGEYTMIRDDFQNRNATYDCGGTRSDNCWVQRAPWESGSFTVISEGPDPHVCSAYVDQERQFEIERRQAWNSAIQAAVEYLEKNAAARGIYGINNLRK